jgi:hypothetical protein
MSRPPAPSHLALLVVVATASGCAHLWPPWPFDSGPQWEVAPTTRLVAYTSQGQPALALQVLEQSCAVLESTLFRTKPIVPVEVLMLDWPDLRRDLGIHRTGAAIAELPGKGVYGRRGLLVVYEQDATTAGALHRLTHLFLHAAAPKAPLWLHEGLASYLEAAEFRDDEKNPSACLGQLPKKDAAVPLSDLFAWSWSDFDESGKWSPYRFSASSVIDYFMTGDGGKLREKLNDLIIQLGEGAGIDEALKKVYPALPVGTLQEKVLEHRQASELSGRGRCPIAYPMKTEAFADSARSRPEPASEEDIEALFLRLRMLPRRDGRVDWYPPDMIGVEGGQFPTRVGLR